jgi:hypothetical protein
VSDVFVVLAIQLHISVLRTRGLDRNIDRCASSRENHCVTGVIACSDPRLDRRMKLDPFASCSKEVDRSAKDVTGGWYYSSSHNLFNCSRSSFLSMV